MTTGQRGVHGEHVDALLAAREAPASARFDVELADAVDHGALDLETAARLQLWHRAAVAEAVDHVRAVLPAALDAVASAREEARRKVEETAMAAAALVAPAPHESKREPTTASAHASTLRDTPEPASTAEPAAPSRLDPQPSRMMVADLVVTRTTAPAHHEHS